MSNHLTKDDGPGHIQAPTFYSLPATPRLMNALSRDQAASDEDSAVREQHAFDFVSRRLKEIGAIPLEDYLSAKPSITTFSRNNTTRPSSADTRLLTPDTDIPRVSPTHVEDRPPSPALLPPAPLSERNLNGDTKTSLPLSRDNAISRLHQTCIHAFGSADTLKYEFLEENGQKSKQCILTVARPDGQQRSYKSEAVFLRRADAKARVATIAMQMGALSFILNGESNSLKGRKGKGVTLSSSGAASATEPGVESSDASAAGRIIENGLAEWRAGKVCPEWIFYNDARVVGQYGAALRVQLSTHSLRIYSCDSIYDSEADAKAACAQKALSEGVLDYIKFGNGQTKPAQLSIEDKEPELFDQQRPSQKGRTRPMTLQSYYESLPQPFPEPFGDKAATEINAPSYINTLLQSARGGRIKYNFYWVVDKITGLLGCLLRLERGKETKSYFVDCQFQKRNDAKAAACLLALSYGLGDYIRSVKASMDANFTPEMRKLASERLIFALNTECNKIRTGNRLNFTYNNDLDAFGASLEIDISTDPEKPNTRKWSVPPEYRSKNDAKLAVCYHAVSQGAIEVLQLKGAPPPPGHVSYWDVIHGRGAMPRAAKRKSAETDVVGEGYVHQKKRRKDWQKLEKDPLGVVNEMEPGELGQESDCSKGTPLPKKARRAVDRKPDEADSSSLSPRTEPEVRYIRKHQEQTHWPGGRDGGSGPSRQSSYHMASPSASGYENFVPPEAPYYPTSAAPGSHHPVSPHMLPLNPSSPVYFHPPTPLSPVAFSTYHLHHSLPEPQFIPHPSMYPHPSNFISAYPQPAVSSYHSIPSPYHSPYAFTPPSPLYLPQSPDGRPMEIYDYHPEMYHHHRSPQMPMQIISMSPPSTPPRPQKVKRIDRNTALLSPRPTESVMDLEGDRKDGEREKVREMASAVKSSKEEKEVECLDPGEETEVEEEEEFMERSQVLERRASMP